MKTHKRKSRIPSACGIGLIALDIIQQHDSIRHYAGGSCGNVLSILAYLGWNSYPIGRIADDPAGKIVLSDLQRWGVRPDFLHLNPLARTPVIVERLSVDANGVPFHSYRFNCPECGGRLPSYQPVTLRSLKTVIESLSGLDVLFIDRVSPAAIRIAEFARDKGALIYFEPTSVRDERQFRRLVTLSHVIKYAQDRIVDLNEICEVPSNLLEIQTLGRGGLRFRFQKRGWHRAAAWPVPTLLDAAGSGDWLSAVLIHLLVRNGVQGFLKSTLATVSQAINAGQAAAAWNCGFVGPRGGMYERPKTELFEVVQQAFKTQLRWNRVEDTPSPSADVITGLVCESCSLSPAASALPRHLDRTLT
jgi:sugar/nucleoside kinase (ribokinase family)